MTEKAKDVARHSKAVHEARPVADHLDLNSEFKDFTFSRKDSADLISLKQAQTPATSALNRLGPASAVFLQAFHPMDLLAGELKNIFALNDKGGGHGDTWVGIPADAMLAKGSLPSIGVQAPSPTRDCPPIVIAILGAPGAGKGYLRSMLEDAAERIQHDRLGAALAEGEELSVDGLRKEVHALPAKEQVDLFLRAHGRMRHGGFWPEYLVSIETALAVIDRESDTLSLSQTSEGAVKVNGATDQESANAVIATVPEEEIQAGIEELDGYRDYRGVLRYLQERREVQSRREGRDVIYDETGADPQSMLTKFRQFRESSEPYVTIAFMIHGKSAGTNLLQNAARMVVGDDQGRDSSSSICQAWSEVDQALEQYFKSAELIRRISCNNGEVIEVVQDSITRASPDNNSTSHSTDFFTVVEPANPRDAYTRILSLLQRREDPLALPFFHAILHFQVAHLSKMDENTKRAIVEVAGPPPSDRELHTILTEVKRSGRFSHGLNNLDKMIEVTQTGSSPALSGPPLFL
jgi:hypothetical protein